QLDSRIPQALRLLALPPRPRAQCVHKDPAGYPAPCCAYDGLKNFVGRPTLIPNVEFHKDADLRAVHVMRNSSKCFQCVWNQSETAAPDGERASDPLAEPIQIPRRRGMARPVDIRQALAGLDIANALVLSSNVADTLFSLKSDAALPNHEIHNGARERQ